MTRMIYQTMKTQKKILIQRKISFKCNCSNNCFENSSATEFRDHIYRLREMAKDEKEMFIMGSVKQIGSKKITSKRKECKRWRYDHSFQGHNICRQTFLIINDCTEKVLKNINRHLNDIVAVTSEHKNTGKKPHHALKYEDIHNAVIFIINYTAEIGMPRLLCVHQNILAGSLCDHVTGITSAFCMRKKIVCIHPNMVMKS